jgi:hypothetical protein
MFKSSPTKFISLLTELLYFYGVFLLIDLVIEFNNFAVGLGFCAYRR